jgi:hypothetical protein
MRDGGKRKQRQSEEVMKKRVGEGMMDLHNGAPLRLPYERIKAEET